MRRRFMREQWSDWIAEQSGSGLSVREFCRQKKLGPKSFYRWRKKLSGRSGDPAADAAAAGQVDSSRKRARSAISQTAKSSSPASFVPLSIVGTASVEIDLPCGATIRLPADEIATRCVLSVLLELGRSQ